MLHRAVDSESGTTLVEFAIVAIVVLTIITLVVQGAFLFGAWLALTNGVREGARYGAPCLNRTVEGCTDADVEHRVRDTTRGFFDPSTLTVTVSHDSKEVTVVATCTVGTVTPVMGDIQLSAKSVMRLENQE